MNEDYSYLFNKNKICSFSFELNHDAHWWIKYRKLGLIGVWSGTSLFFVLGIIMWILQGCDNRRVVAFIICGIFMWGFAFLWFIDSYIVQASTIRRYTNNLLALFNNGINEGYLCSDLTKYPYFMQIARNGLTFNTWKISASFADKEPKCNMPIWGLVALFTSIKKYQSQYCSINQDNTNNA